MAAFACVSKKTASVQWNLVKDFHVGEGLFLRNIVKFFIKAEAEKTMTDAESQLWEEALGRGENDVEDDSEQTEGEEEESKDQEEDDDESEASPPAKRTKHTDGNSVTQTLTDTSESDFTPPLTDRIDTKVESSSCSWRIDKYEWRFHGFTRLTTA